MSETAKEAAKEVASSYSDSLSGRGYNIYSSMEAAGFTEAEIKETIDDLSTKQGYEDLKK